MSNQGWQEALRFKARLTQYSFLNTSLILAQYPTATYVAGFRRWTELGRHVRKGEKGIAIIAPILTRPKPNEKDGKDARLGEERVRVPIS